MNPRRSWIPPAVLLGVWYAAIGILFAVPATHVQGWRWAAWVLSAAGYAAHIAYERVRLSSSPWRSALHVAVGVALGAFGLAVGANIHSLSAGSVPEHRRLLLLALGIWPVMTAVPAFLVALGANVVLTPRTLAKPLKILALALGVALVLVLLGGVWAVWFAEPPVSVMIVGPAVRIDTRFLGEYYVAASLIEVAGADGTAVLRAKSSTADCRSDLFVFAAGYNDVPALATRDCAVEAPSGSPTFKLEAGEAYTFTVVGSNWFGHPRKASRQFVVPLAGR